MGTTISECVQRDKMVDITGDITRYVDSTYAKVCKLERRLVTLERLVVNGPTRQRTTYVETGVQPGVVIS